MGALLCLVQPASGVEGGQVNPGLKKWADNLRKSKQLWSFPKLKLGKKMVRVPDRIDPAEAQAEVERILNTHKPYLIAASNAKKEKKVKQELEKLKKLGVEVLKTRSPKAPRVGTGRRRRLLDRLHISEKRG